MGTIEVALQSRRNKLCHGVYTIRGFRVCQSDVGLYRNTQGHFARDNQSLIMTQAIQLYFMSHVLQSGLYTWRIKNN